MILQDVSCAVQCAFLWHILWNKCCIVCTRSSVASGDSASRSSNNRLASPGIVDQNNSSV